MRYPKELLKGITPLVIMEILREAPCSGFHLVGAIRARSGDTLEIGEGTVYPLLYRLEGKKLIRGEWEAGKGTRSHKVYRLTRRGAEELERQKATWRDFATAVSLFTGGSQ
ncbi:MAG: helix-turn-helix transcriptional regulator [Kiritimatiellae bacterium]|nr:helix-turn-helix transcriptional regulator [Kiritimatiellia bacterium]